MSGVVTASAGGAARRFVVGAALLVALSGCTYVSQGRNAEGTRYFQQGDYQAAARKFQEALSADPRNANGYYNLAATYHKLGQVTRRPEDFAQAEQLYRQSLNYDPNHVDSHRGLAVLLVEQGRSMEAFRTLEDWARQNPNYAAARVELARLYEEAGDLASARLHLVDSLALEPTNARALAALGHVNERLGNYAQALSNYQRSLATDQFQTEVAARAAALRTALAPPGSLTLPPPVAAPPTGTVPGWGTPPLVR